MGSPLGPQREPRLYRAAVAALAEFYAPTCPAAAVIARRTQYATDAQAFCQHVEPALAEYAETLPPPLRALIEDAP